MNFKVETLESDLESEYANINSAMSLIVAYSDKVLNNQDHEDVKSIEYVSLIIVNVEIAGEL